MHLSGKKESLPYSLSRWTDLPDAKWGWFLQQLQQGWMVGFDPRTAIPGQWSLAPDDTFGLVFWTKNPQNLIDHAEALKPYPMVIHMTLTGWEEVEKGAPTLDEGVDLLKRAADTFGPDKVTWRFSPVPITLDVVDRFLRIAKGVEAAGVKEVYLAFLQENDLMPETRNARARRELLKAMSRGTNLQLRLCNEDRTLGEDVPIVGSGASGNAKNLPANLAYGICEAGTRFSPTDYGIDRPKTEGCGCALSVDPFTFNESCTLGCRYCYAADKSLSPKKRNTTKGARTNLPVVR